MSFKKMGVFMLCFTLALLILAGGFTILFDPFFHYHAPFEQQRYTIRKSDERYCNDGIARNFSYNAMITGTSMSENFKPSELDQLFGVTSVKVPFSGASYLEIDQFIKRAIEYQPDLKLIVRNLDLGYIWNDKDYWGYEGYPDYLYDDNVWNDVQYIFNKDTLLLHSIPVALQTILNEPSTTMDEYASWNDLNTFGKDVVLSQYNRREEIAPSQAFTDKDREHIRAMIEQNVLQTVAENPDIQFYLFFPQNSIIYWDSLHREGTLERQIAALELAANMMLEYDNIHLYSFVSDFETVCDLNNYKDHAHYNEKTNSKILQCMKNEEFLLTKENCNEYFQSVYSFYTEYDYESIFS